MENSEDRPLSGPWDRTPRNGDKPLPGPWETSAQDGHGSSAGPWEQEQPQSRYEYEAEHEEKLPVVAFDLPLALGEQDSSPGAVIEEPEKNAPRPVERYAGHPLAALLGNKNALVGGIIIGEVLNSRGGKVKKGPGYPARLYGSAGYNPKR